jgi:hypothetical protein
MWTTALQGFGAVAALLGAYFDLRYWVVKGGTGAPPTLPDSLTVAAVRARVSA